MLTVQAERMGAALDPGAPVTGVVHSVFDHAVNLIVGPWMWTLVDDAARLSPFAVQVAVLPPVRAGEAVFVRAGYLRIGEALVDARSAAVWTPAPWIAGPGIAGALAVAGRQAGGRAWAGTAGLVHDVMTALDRGEGLGAAVRRAVGRGPGLTPSGDDALVGILAGLTLSPLVQRGMVEGLAGAIAPCLEGTTEISRHLLVQAMQGHFARPLHDLGRAIHAPGRDLEVVIERALAVGATSGADACLGLTAALAEAVTPQQVAA